MRRWARTPRIRAQRIDGTALRQNACEPLRVLHVGISRKGEREREGQEDDMSLIEHLDDKHWKEALQGFFEYALGVLKDDRFRRVGSAVDDLRSWLTAGGIQRVKERLDEQMQARRFSVERQEAIRQVLDELVRKNGHALLELMAGRVIPTTGRELLSACGMEELELEDLLLWMMAGARPFEERMHEMGRSDEEIAEIYRLIDRWLAEQGLVPPPDANRN